MLRDRIAFEIADDARQPAVERIGFLPRRG